MRSSRHIKADDVRPWLGVGGAQGPLAIVGGAHPIVRLQQLTEQARKLSQVSPDELNEMVHLYQRSGSNLAHARIEYAADSALVNRLTLLVSDAHGVLYGQRDTEVRRGITQFATVTFPASIYALRKYILVAALLTFVPWAVFQIWLSISPTAFDVVAPAGAGEQYINQDFEDYYSNQPSQNFATQCSSTTSVWVSWPSPPVSCCAWSPPRCSPGTAPTVAWPVVCSPTWGKPTSSGG